MSSPSEEIDNLAHIARLVAQVSALTTTLHCIIAASSDRESIAVALRSAHATTESMALASEVPDGLSDIRIELLASMLETAEKG